MVDVLEKVLEKRPDAVLLFVGGYSTTYDGYYENVQKYVHEKGLDDKVIFTGERKDANRILNAMDVFLFPSLWEGLGIVAVEAQANGLPVVASTKVPRDTKLTNLIHYVDLDAPLDMWVTAIIKSSRLKERRSRGDEIRAKGYDLETESVRLQEMYFKLGEIYAKSN